MRIDGISGKMRVDKTWSDDNFCTRGKCCGVSDVVPVVMTPNDGSDATSIDIDAVFGFVFIFAKNFCNVFFDGNFPVEVLEFGGGGEEFPVFADAEVEEDGFIGR